MKVRRRGRGRKRVRKYTRTLPGRKSSGRSEELSSIGRKHLEKRRNHAPYPTQEEVI